MQMSLRTTNLLVSPFDQKKHLSNYVRMSNVCGTRNSSKNKRKTSLTLEAHGALPGVFMIAANDRAGEPFGIIDFGEEDVGIHGAAKVWVFLDDSEKQLPTFGTEVITAILQIGFNRMRLNKVSTDAKIEDHVWVNLLRNAGFFPEVRKRSHMSIKGNYVTLSEYAMLESHYRR